MVGVGVVEGVWCSSRNLRPVLHVKTDGTERREWDRGESIVNAPPSSDYTVKRNSYPFSSHVTNWTGEKGGQRVEEGKDVREERGE